MHLLEETRPLLNAIGLQSLIHHAPEGVARARYQPRPEFAHSGGTVVQGGFITAWLDGTMAFAIAARDPAMRLASLEIKVSFLEAVGMTPVEAEARVLRWGRSVVFLEAALYDDQQRVLATASSTGKLVRALNAAAPA